MLRALEILLGLVLGCLGLMSSFGTVAATVSFQKKVAGDLSALSLHIGISAALIALLFVAAWLLLRTPRASGAVKRRVRWLAVSGTGTSLLLLVAFIAVPNYMRFSQGRISSEAKVMLSAIRIGEEGYFAEFGEYVAFTSVPSGPPGQTPVNRIEYPEGAKTIGFFSKSSSACGAAMRSL